MSEKFDLGQEMLQAAADGLAEFIGAGIDPTLGPVAGWVSRKIVGIFGKYIVNRWRVWMSSKTRDEQAAAVVELSRIPPEKAREIIAAAIEQKAPKALPDDKRLVIKYLSAIPATTRRSLVPDSSARAGLSLPPGRSPDDPSELLRLLPSRIAEIPTGFLTAVGILLAIAVFWIVVFQLWALLAQPIVPASPTGPTGLQIPPGLTKPK